MNQTKQFLDPLSYKLSVLFKEIMGNDGYKNVVNSYHKTNPELSRSKKKVNILEPKGFGKVYRVFALGQDQSILNESKSLEIEIDNVYETLLKSGPDSII